ncbi:MAG TPA: GNAT family N-acetyltransferase [Thermoanaerobaculia bacterium]|nr:GNAT family N-acetyltransferase [Thermoanaerobaculia bacterium]
MPAEFTTREVRAGDETAILDLFARSFPHAPRALAHFEWKYRRNPFGNEHISLTFDGDGRLVAHYAGYVVPFRADGRDFLAHQIGDTMTDVAIRHIGRGPTSILGRTALHFYERFCEGQVAFNYGFNVANIQKFSLRFLRSDRVEDVTYRVRDLRAHPLTRVPRASRWMRGYQLELVRETNEEWDELFDRAAAAYEFCVRRNAQYVRWRYLQCPDISYIVIAIRKWRRLVGWIAFRVIDHRLALGDAFFDPKHADAVGIMLRHVVPSYPVDAIEAWFPPRPHWFDAILRDLHFETRPQPQDLGVMCVPFAWPDVVPRMRESLHFTWGDSDLF